MFKEQPDIQITDLLNNIFGNYLADIIIDYYSINYYPVFDPEVKYNIIVKTKNYKKIEKGCSCNRYYHYYYYDENDEKERWRFQNTACYKFFGQYYTLGKYYNFSHKSYVVQFRTVRDLLRNEFYLSKEIIDYENLLELEKYDGAGGSKVCKGHSRFFGGDDGW